MKYKFNPYERAVGFFFVTTLLGSVAIGVGVAIKKNWLDHKVNYLVYTDTASNLREGTGVYFSGIKIGNVEKIELDQEKLKNNVKVTFSILKNFQQQMTIGSEVQFMRPFVIGEKSLNIIKTSLNHKLITPGETLPTYSTFDLMDVLTGKQLEGMLIKLDNIISNVDKTMLIGKTIAVEINDKKKIKKTIDDLSFSIAEIRKVVPYISQNAPAASEHLGKIIENLAFISTSVRNLQPEGAKTLELLHESVITLKAMQKSMFLKSNVEEVKEEMSQDPLKRLPASK
jgi:phospholipid/cholesterol/gamma-HCH transport system substrate-binding protein